MRSMADLILAAPIFLVLIMRPPPSSTLFPYTTLFRSLAPRRWQGDHIAMGTNTDPYQRAEGKYRLTQGIDRKSTRLNSSHTVISYAVFCLKKKNLRDQKIEPLQEARVRSGHNPTLWVI